MQARLRTIQQKVEQTPLGRPWKMCKTDPTIWLYRTENVLWVKFKESLGMVDLHPDLPTLMLFFQWYSANSKGKLDKHSIIGTLEWKVGRFAYIYIDYYGHKIL